MSWSLSGYTCSRCGQVTLNESHACIPFSTQQPMQPDAVAMALGRIEAMLQQIQRKLESK